MAASARRVQRRPSAAPAQAMRYESVGVSQPKLKWFMVPIGASEREGHVPLACALSVSDAAGRYSASGGGHPKM
ncbi:hypothetical protein GCM10010440_45130 [Kitasatospora cinereorecta]